MADLLLGSRALLNWLVKGGSGFVGLQARLDAVYSSVASDKRPKAQLRFAYDANRKGLVVIESPLPHPLVTLLINNRTKQSFYHRDRLPNGAGTHAWNRQHNMQWDVWGRTPVEVEGLTDALEIIVVSMAEQAYDVGRIRLELGEFENAPYEEDLEIYRAIAHGSAVGSQAA